MNQVQVKWSARFCHPQCGGLEFLDIWVALEVSNEEQAIWIAVESGVVPMTGKNAAHFGQLLCSQVGLAVYTKTARRLCMNLHQLTHTDTETISRDEPSIGVISKLITSLAAH